MTRLQGGLRPPTGSTTTGADADAVRLATENARDGFIQVMDDDLNTSAALATMFELVRAINTARTAGVGGPFYNAAQKTLVELGNVLGITLDVVSATVESTGGAAAQPFVDLLVQVRTDLRTAKQWALADQIRDQLQELQVVIEDSAAGTTWRFEE